MAEPQPEDEVYGAVLVVATLTDALAEIIVTIGEGDPSQSIAVCNKGKYLN